MTVWLAWRSIRADPRAALAATIVAFVSTSALTFVLGLAVSSEITRWIEPDPVDADVSPIVVATALAAVVVLIRVHALAVRGDEVQSALLSTAGLSPRRLVRLALARAGGCAVLGAVLAAPLAHVLVLVLVRPSLDVVVPSPVLLVGGSLSWTCSAASVVVLSLLSARSAASRASTRLPARVLRGEGADRTAAAAPSAGRMIVVAAMWLVFVLPVAALVLLWDGLTAALTSGAGFFDETDVAAFSELAFFTPALRLLALHSTASVVLVGSLVVLYPSSTPWFVRRWTRLVPPGRRVVWRLTRARAVRGTVAGVSTTVTVGLFVGLVMATGSALDLGVMLGVAPAGASASQWGQTALALGPASAVALAGAAASTLLSGPRCDPDRRHLSAHGARPSIARRIALAEGLVVVLTATLPVGLVVATSTGLSLALAVVTGVPVTPALPNVVPVVVATVLATVVVVGATGAAQWLDRGVVSAPRTRSATARATARPWRR
jgi:putative ABC transport system permease protein